MYEIAKKYINAGFSVIPLNGKIPAIDWKEYQTRYATDEELKQWFSQKCNIGIVTGKISGISVVDVDAKSGGLETLKQLHLPITWTVKTGGGGWHYYYAYDERIQQTANIYQGIDIRNDGGQVVAPPSIHQSGQKYSWTYKEDDITKFPIELFERKEIIKKNWSDILVKGATEGNRNSLSASLFGKLFNLFHPDEWESIVYPLAEIWNYKNKPPLDEKELRRTFESVASRAINNERKPSLYEILKDSYTPQEIAEKIKVENKNIKKFFTWGDADLDETLPLVELKTYVVIFGQFSSGKTTYAMFMAKRNAEAGHKVCFLTLEMSKEKLIRQYAFKREGITKQQYKHGKYSEDIFEKYTNEIKDIEYIGIEDEKSKTEYSLNDIEEIIKTQRPDIIFIDNFNKLVSSGKSELDGDNRTSSRLLFMTRQYKVSIVLIHHTNKPRKDCTNILKGISALRGTNKINDDADIVVEIGRPPKDTETNYPKDLSMLGVYKDRDWDCTGIHRLRFNNGTFQEETSIREIANSFGGEIQF